LKPRYPAEAAIVRSLIDLPISLADLANLPAAPTTGKNENASNAKLVRRFPTA
jgi:hypothetical protein